MSSPLKNESIRWLPDMYEEFYDVVVIGAGLAGLQAAKSIASLSPSLSILVLEASSNLGGRIRQVEGLVPWPVEAGAEFLHGTRHSSIQKISASIGCQERELPYPDRYFFGDTGSLLLSEEAEQHPDIVFIHKLFGDMAHENFTGKDISVAEYLLQKGASLSQLHFAEAIYANDFGCSIQTLGLRECIHEAQNWIYGDTYLILDRPLSSVIHWLAKSLKVRCDWPVTKIQYGSQDGIVRIENDKGKYVSAKKVVITVPLTVLKEGDIFFDPPLPPEKTMAIKTIGMSNAVKVVIAFSGRFWPEDLFDVVCSGCFLPEIWMTQHPISTSKGSSLRHSPVLPPLGKFVAVGFAAGEQASRICCLSEGEVFQRALSQLDKIFGAKIDSSTKAYSILDSQISLHTVNLNETTVQSSQNSKLLNDQTCSSHKNISSQNGAHMQDISCLKIEVVKDSRNLFIPTTTSQNQMKIIDKAKYPASSSFVGGIVFDWSKVPYIKGAYTYPTIGAFGSREVLSKPIDKMIFFAGEATHLGVNPCMQGALDTGDRVAGEVVNSFKLSRL